MKDPGNMGTIIRTAAALGCESILISGSESASPWSTKVLRSAMGAHFHVRIVDRVSVEQLKEMLETTMPRPVLVYADSKPQKTNSISHTSLAKRLKHTDHVCLVIGNETNGVSEEILQLESSAARYLSVRIPIEKPIESLNCSIAFAVIAFEIRNILTKT